MSTLRKTFIALSAMVVAGIFASSTARAQMTVIGNWEAADPNSPGGGGNFNSDGWIDWATAPTDNNQHGHAITESQFTTATPPKYSASTTTGVTLGTQSLELQASGYSQDLALKTEFTTGDNAAFFANKAFALDVTYPSYTAAQNASGGFQEIYQFFLNAGGTSNGGSAFGFQAITANPVPTTHANFAMGAATNPVSYTLRIDYADELPLITNPTYAEFIFATNSSDATHSMFFFDNARLYTPGDMNNDGHVDAKDIPAMELALTDPTAYKNTYWAGNPNYTDADRILIGDMQGADLNIGPGPNGIRMVGDGVFNGADLQYLIAYLQDGAGSTSAVPEPAALTLLALAGPGLWWMARRKRNASSTK